MESAVGTKSDTVSVQAAIIGLRTVTDDLPIGMSVCLD
jgi:hypothetical protein